MRKAGCRAHGFRHVYRPPEVIVEVGRTSRERGRFIGVVEGIEVFAADVPVGVAWLFSARLLRRMGFAAVEGRRVDPTWSPEDDDALSGPMTVSFRQVLEWEDYPVFEILGPGAWDPGPE